jgi:uncharacterized glyoxalase superfamily protein PhnB
MATKLAPAKKKPARKAAKSARKPAKTARKTAKRVSARPKARAVSHKKRHQPESLRVRQAMPSFTVNDLQRSVAWYRDVLGLVVDEEWKNDGLVMGVTMKAGTTLFMLGQDDFAKGRDRKKGEGFRIYCSTAQDVDQLAAGIVARGGVLATPPTSQSWGSRDFSVVDPDGFKLSFGSM